MPSHRRRGAALAVAAVLALGACSSDPEEPDTSPPPAATPSPAATTETETPTPEPTPPPEPEPLGVSGTYSGTMTVDVYEGWYDQWEPGAPRAGDELDATLTLHDDCDVEGSRCTFEYGGFDPDDGDDVSVIEEATVSTDSGSVQIETTLDWEWECWEDDEFIGLVDGPLNYAFHFTDHDGDRYTSVDVHYEVPPANGVDYCDGHTVSTGSLTKQG